MYKDRRQRKIIMFSLIFTLICMTVGYASFQSNLNITGSSTVTSNWDIEITNVTSGTASGTAENTVSPTWDKLTASMEANLYGKDDSMEYDVTIENKGTLDAKLEDITTNLENANNDAVVITFSGYTKGEKLLKGESKTIHVKIAYNPSYTGDETSSEVEINFNYVQNNNEKSPSSSTYLLTYDYSTNGGTSTDLDKEYLTTGDSVNLEYKAIKKGYTFVGWNTDKDSEVGLETYQMPSSNTTLYAIYSKTLKVTYTKDEYTSSIAKENDNCNIYNNQTGCEITLPEITSLNDILGWYEGDNKVGASNDKYTLTKDTALIAKSEEPEPIMMARNTSKAFWQSDYNSKISTVDILANKDVPDNAVASWDVSEKQNKSVMAWIVDDSENSGMYKLYIGGDGKVIAPSNSSYLFNGYGSGGSTNYGTFYKTTSMNLANLDTSRVTDMYGMFYGCSSLISLDVSHFDTNKVTNMGYMFYCCSSFTSLDVSNFDTNKATNMGYMFAGCKSLTSLDVSNFDTGKVTNMSYMFNNCSKITSLNVSNFSTSKVTDMRWMFSNCSSLTSLDVSNFDTSKVTSMEYMFSYCSSLTSLDLSNFDTSNVTDMAGMFSYCGSLTSLNISSFDTSNVTYMHNMFTWCSSLTSLDVSNFDTSKVTNMRQMFQDCNNLTKLSLCSFDTSKVTNMEYMFYEMWSVPTVYVGPSWTTKSVTSSDNFCVIGIPDSKVCQSVEIIQSDNCAYETEEINISLAYTSTTNSIIVVAKASATSGISKYEYSKDDGSTWIESDNNTYTFTDLTLETSYNIKVRVTSNLKKQAISDSTTVSTDSIIKPTFTESGTLEKTIEITYPSGCGSTYTCTYQKDNETEVTVTSTTASVSFTEDGSLVAKVSDGTNIVSSSYSVKVDTNGSKLCTNYTVTSGDGLYSDDIESGRCVYKGANPNNYITLGSDMYRIIAVESDGTLKVIKNGSIGDIAFDTSNARYSTVSTDYCNSTYGCKVWGSKTTMLDSSGNNVTTMPREVGGTEYNLPDTEATLNTYLNNDWYNSLSSIVQSKIVTHMFNVGVTKDKETNLSNTITQEQTYKWKGKVGLMTVSDYVKASTNSACTSVYAYNSISSCYNNSATHNWIFAGPANKTYLWTSSPYSDSFADFVFRVYGDGSIAGYIALRSSGVAPVLYLSSDITLSGEGTSSNPYILSGN